MPKPKPQRDNVFGEENEEPAPRIPFIPASAVNGMYETGFAGLPSAAFEDPVEKENAALKNQLADLMQQIQSRTSDLLVQDGNLIVLDFQFSPTGLIAPDQFSQEAWEQIGLLLFKLEGAIQWLIGDWLVYGADLKYGDIDDIARALGREPETLHQYASVCRNVKSWIRIHNLSYGHHKLVAPLDQDKQAAALAYAAEHGLSVANFRKYLRGDRGEAALPTGDERNYKVLSTQFEKWRAADPSKAKPQDLEQVRFVREEMRRELEDFDRKWGL